MWWMRLYELRIIQCLTLLWRLHDSGCQLLSNIWGFHSNELRILVLLVVTFSSGVIHSQCCEGMYCPRLHGSKSLQSMPDTEEKGGICLSTTELVGWDRKDKQANSGEAVPGMTVWALKRAIIQCAVWDFSRYHWGADGPVRALKRAWTRTGQKKEIFSEEK